MLVDGVLGFPQCLQRIGPSSMSCARSDQQADPNDERYRKFEQDLVGALLDTAAPSPRPAPFGSSSDSERFSMGQSSGLYAAS